MEEQTKILVLLVAVIVVAVVSLIFVFYQYSKLQSQFTARVLDQSSVRGVDNAPFFIQRVHEVKDVCEKPACVYGSGYRVGPQRVETGVLDVNGKIVSGCHAESTELNLRAVNRQCFIQKLKCVAGGWTVISPQLACL